MKFEVGNICCKSFTRKVLPDLKLDKSYKKTRSFQVHVFDQTNLNSYQVCIVDS